MPVALYVDTERGPYPALGVDCWDIDKDARKYAGPWPGVAHPPCQDWGTLRRFALDLPERKACGPAAVEQVRRWGGVLEHPAGSHLWNAKSMALPGGGQQDMWGGWSVEVDQCDWGHPARKTTWLYIVGCQPSQMPPQPQPRKPTHVIAPARTAAARAAARGKHIPKSRRHLTPPEFASWLLQVAAACKQRTP